MSFSGPSPHTWGLRPERLSQTSILTVHPHIRGVYVLIKRFFHIFFRSIPTYVGFSVLRGTALHGQSVHPHIRGVFVNRISTKLTFCRSIPTYVGFSFICSASTALPPVHPHIRGVFGRRTRPSLLLGGPSPHTWGFPHSKSNVSHTGRSIPTYVGFSDGPPGTYNIKNGPSPHTWGFLHSVDAGPVFERSIPTYVGFSTPRTAPRHRPAVHPHIRGVFTEIKSKISRASSKTALLPAEKFKILFLVKIKSSAAAFQVHTIFRDQFPPGLHFEIALHL